LIQFSFKCVAQIQRQRPDYLRQRSRHVFRRGAEVIVHRTKREDKNVLHFSVTDSSDADYAGKILRLLFKIKFEESGASAAML